MRRAEILAATASRSTPTIFASAGELYQEALALCCKTGRVELRNIRLHCVYPILNYGIFPDGDLYRMSALSTRPTTESNIDYQKWLGHGAFGIVLKAVDTSQSATAVKFIFPSTDQSDSNEQTQIAREYKISSELAPHPNIVKMKTVDERKFSLSELTAIFSDSILQTEEQRRLTSYYIDTAKRQDGIIVVRIQMEMCGENLRKWLNCHLPAKSRTLNSYQFTIIKNLTSGLKHLHDNKIIHRDLKPENIMFSKKGFELPVKIGDFGLSRNIHMAESKTSSLTSRVGTEAYMAPETFTREYDVRAYLFALGLVIWEVMQHIPLNARKRLFDRLVNDREVDLVNNNVAFPNASQLIVRLTKRKVEDRPQHMGEVTNLVMNWVRPKYSLYQHEVSTTFEPSEGRTEFIARNSYELRTCLSKANSGSIIRLQENNYVGKFVIDKDHITLIGQGPAIFVNAETSNEYFTVSGNNNNISNIKFSCRADQSCFWLSGNHNCVSGVKFTGGKVGIFITGNENRLENISSTKCDESIKIEGSSNILDGIQFDSIKGTCIYVTEKSDGNMIKTISGINIPMGIMCDGKNNEFTKIRFSKTIHTHRFCGVMFSSSGHSNRINDLVSSNSGENDWDLVIQSNKFTATDCTCSKILVYGENVTLANVNCSDKILVEKYAVNINLRNCRGKLLQLESPVMQEDCLFETTLDTNSTSSWAEWIAQLFFYDLRKSNS